MAIELTVNFLQAKNENEPSDLTNFSIWATQLVLKGTSAQDPWTNNQLPPMKTPFGYEFDKWMMIPNWKVVMQDIDNPGVKPVWKKKIFEVIFYAPLGDLGDHMTWNSSVPIKQVDIEYQGKVTVPAFDKSKNFEKKLIATSPSDGLPHEYEFKHWAKTDDPSGADVSSQLNSIKEDMYLSPVYIDKGVAYEDVLITYKLTVCDGVQEIFLDAGSPRIVKSLVTDTDVHGISLHSTTHPFLNQQVRMKIEDEPCTCVCSVPASDLVGTDAEGADWLVLKRLMNRKNKALEYPLGAPNLSISKNDLKDNGANASPRYELSISLVFQGIIGFPKVGDPICDPNGTGTYSKPYTLTINNPTGNNTTAVVKDVNPEKQNLATTSGIQNQVGAKVDGYELKGWKYQVGNLDTTSVNDFSTPVVIPNQHVTITLVWEIVKYKITVENYLGPDKGTKVVEKVPGSYGLDDLGINPIHSIGTIIDEKDLKGLRYLSGGSGSGIEPSTHKVKVTDKDVVIEFQWGGDTVTSGWGSTDGPLVDPSMISHGFTAGWVWTREDFSYYDILYAKENGTGDYIRYAVPLPDLVKKNHHPDIYKLPSGAPIPFFANRDEYGTIKYDKAYWIGQTIFIAEYRWIPLQKNFELIYKQYEVTDIDIKAETLVFGTIYLDYIGDVRRYLVGTQYINDIDDLTSGKLNLSKTPE